MADTSPLAGLLDRAGHVFGLANELGWAFSKDRKRRGEGFKLSDPHGWERHESDFNEFYSSLLELQAPMQNPPAGFAPVAEVLLKTAQIAKQIRDTMQTADGRAGAEYLDFFPALNSAATAGREAIKAATKARRADDPFAFVDKPAASEKLGIDTTPTLAKPPPGLIAAAGRAIPDIMGPIQPDHNDAVELVAADLAARLKDNGHNLAAAHWAIHEAVQAGRLRAEVIQVALPFAISRSGQVTGPTRGTIAIPEGKQAPFDCFKVVAMQALWDWWHSLSDHALEQVEPAANSDANCEHPREPATIPPSPKKSKRSTERGEGEVKLIPALTEHHKYADGGCLNLEPIGNNELARKAKVSESTASNFFNRKFGGHAKYKALCHDVVRLAGALKLLNGEFSPQDLYGRRPADEGDRDNQGDE